MKHSWTTNAYWQHWMLPLLSKAYPKWSLAHFLQEGEISAVARRLLPLKPSENTRDSGCGRSYSVTSHRQVWRKGRSTKGKSSKWNKALCSRLCMTPRGTFQLLRITIFSPWGTVRQGEPRAAGLCAVVWYFGSWLYDCLRDACGWSLAISLNTLVLLGK